MKYELHIEMNNKAKALKETYSVESGNLRQMVERSGSPVGRWNLGRGEVRSTEPLFLVA